MILDIIIEPSKSDPGMWYWAVRLDGEVYADGEAESEDIALHRAELNRHLLETWE